VQLPLALNQRPVAQVLAVEVQKIEGAELRGATAEQELIELRATGLVQAGDLPVEHRMPGSQ
jgi:hypothetical protein